MFRKKYLIISSPEQSFWMNNGLVVDNLRELYEALKIINDKQFFYHANKNKNDFSKWIEEVLLDKACANSLRRVYTRDGAIRAIARALKNYK